MAALNGINLETKSESQEGWTPEQDAVATKAMERARQRLIERRNHGRI